MLAYFETTLTWTDLARRTWREMIDDDALGLAAQLAYYFFLALCSPRFFACLPSPAFSPCTTSPTR
jgi:uncharacterized BrkB/YihY/UPF0761 family membrane protein